MRISGSDDVNAIRAELEKGFATDLSLASSSLHDALPEGARTRGVLASSAPEDAMLDVMKHVGEDLLGKSTPSSTCTPASSQACLPAGTLPEEPGNQPPIPKQVFDCVTARADAYANLAREADKKHAELSACLSEA